MKNFSQKIEPRDIIALFTIGGGFVLKFSGADGLVGTLLTAIVIYYFARRMQNNDEQAS